MKKALGFLLSMVLCTGLMTANVSAESYTQDRLDVVMQTDKDVYSSTDSIKVTLSVTNSNDYPVSNVNLENIIPDGYTSSSEYSLEKTIPVLSPDETADLTAVYIPQALPANDDWPNEGIRPAGTILPVVSANDGEDLGVGSGIYEEVDEDSGLSDGILLIVVAAVVTGTIVFVVNADKKKKKSMMSLLLCVGFTGSMIASIATISAEAAGYETRTINAGCNVSVNGSIITLKSNVSYSFLVNSESDNITIDMTGTLQDETTLTYYLFDKKDVLNGTVSKTTGLSEISYLITDCNNNVLMNGTLLPSAKWMINNLTLIVGENTITVTAKYEDGTSEVSTIIVNNLCEENMDGLDVDQGDNDNDGVLNFIEVMYHTDPDKADTDGDGLSDYDEMAILNTNPLLADTDGNGVSDKDEDHDNDGLANYDEIYVYKTSPISIDSDGDGLSDYDEIHTYRTDPTNADTDGDSAQDGWEVTNGFDPLTRTTDFKGLDPTGSNKVITSDGSEVTPVFDDAYLDSSLPGYMGVEPYDVSVGSSGSTQITVSFDPSGLTAEDQPTLYYFDENTQKFEPVETTVTAGGTATATVTKSGKYVLLNRRYVNEVWKNDLTLGYSGNGTIDIAFVIDRSASMNANDPQGIRKRVVKEFIDRLRDNDRAAIIQYTSIAETIMHMTTNKEELKTAVDEIQNSDGGGCAGSDTTAGTNGAAGIRNALDEFASSTATYKYIIFLTDGSDTTTSYSYDDLIAEALSNEIIIHTVGLVGSGEVDIELLQRIADGTKGNYYLATIGEEAENIPDNALLIEDVYDDIGDLTFDKLKGYDSNHDGISDYLTKLMCDGKILTTKGTLLFGGYSYEEVQDIEYDFDGDGLLNGEEIEIVDNDDGIYAIVHSYPYDEDSDNDGLNDYQETKEIGTSPLKPNSYLDAYSIEFMTDNRHFLSNEYFELYNNSSLERGAVWVGNAFFGSTFDQTSIYQACIIKMFEAIGETQEETLAKKYNKEFAENLTKEILNQYENAIERAETEDKLLESTKSLSEIINTMLTILNPPGELDKTGIEISNWVTKLSTLSDRALVTEHLQSLNYYAYELQTFKEADYWTEEMTSYYIKTLSNQYMTECGKIDGLNWDISVKTSAIDKFFKGAKIFNFLLEEANTIGDTVTEYNRMAANLDTMKNNIELLNAIYNDSDSNFYLKNAAGNVKYYLNNMYNGDLNIWGQFAAVSDYIKPVGETALSTIMHELVGEVVIGGVPVGAIIELVRVFYGNNVLHIDDLSETAAQTVAYTSMASSLSQYYINQIGYKTGTGTLVAANNAKLHNGNIVAYADFSEKLPFYMIDIAVARRLGEDMATGMYKNYESIKPMYETSLSNCKTAIEAAAKSLERYYGACA